MSLVLRKTILGFIIIRLGVVFIYRTIVSIYSNNGYIKKLPLKVFKVYCHTTTTQSSGITVFTLDLINTLKIKSYSRRKLANIWQKYH